jgi:CheY-like chemotaxis protein
MNICTNARQAIGGESGTLRVRLSEIVVTDREPVHECPQIVPGRYLEITISDTGCGIEQAVISKIFDPFFTTKEKGKGTGLGLSVVHGIIKQHRGEITVHSKAGQETVFCIYLPVIEDELADEYAVGEDIPRGSGQHILFVDDEPAIADLMKQKLENIGYRVTIFTSSVEALNAYRENPDGFDVLITDLTMPQMTGMELSRILIAEQADLPIILCTGYSEAINEEKARSVGIFTYLKKPVDTLTFAKAIRQALQTS